MTPEFIGLAVGLVFGLGFLYIVLWYLDEQISHIKKNEDFNGY